LRKAKKLRLEEISEKMEKVAEKEKIDIDKLIDEAIRWARSKSFSLKM
jgi:hypothetical protein